MLLPSSQWKSNMIVEKCSADNRERDIWTRSFEQTDQGKENWKEMGSCAGHICQSREMGEKSH
jgi:hypothetical protein